jgi:hypothetical protein
MLVSEIRIESMLGSTVAGSLFVINVSDLTSVSDYVWVYYEAPSKFTGPAGVLRSGVVEGYDRNQPAYRLVSHILSRMDEVNPHVLSPKHAKLVTKMIERYVPKSMSDPS